MVHVNFEVYQGLLNKQSLQVDYRNFILPALALPKDDVAWGNRIVWTCARILQWSQGHSHQLDEWHMLNAMVDDWERDRPSSFDAFFYRKSGAIDGQSVELWFPRICHGTSTFV